MVSSAECYDGQCAVKGKKKGQTQVFIRAADCTVVLEWGGPGGRRKGRGGYWPMKKVTTTHLVEEGSLPHIHGYR